MFARLMNSFYYGKSGKGDYRKEDLPKNRWQLFWEMLRIRPVRTVPYQPDDLHRLDPHDGGGCHAA